MAQPGSASRRQASAGKVGSSRKTPAVIRWVIAHEPISTFEEAATFFADRVHRDTDGRVEIRILSGADAGRGKRLSPAEAIRKVAAGELEMCQTYTSAFGKLHDPLLALDLPFLFRDHAHAADVLDGPIGTTLMGGLSPHQIRGLAFTYSGGYRVLETRLKAIQSLEDLEGLRIRTSDSPVAMSSCEAFGSTPVPASLEEVPALARAGEIDGAETTYPRYWQRRHYDFHPVVSETHHSLLLTMMAVHQPFFQRLPSACRAAVESAAKEAALFERKRSIEIGAEARRMCPERGVRIAALPPAEKKKLQARAQGVYRLFASRFGPMVDAIRAR